MTLPLPSPLFSVCRRAAALVLLASAALVAPGAHAQTPGGTPQQQVFAAERAFAKSMADRDPDAFARFIADDAIFFNGQPPLRGRAHVVSGWSRFFEGTVAPFSWEPDQVEVLASGDLALSTGLVRNPEGKAISRFNSIWRLEAPGTWRVIFDKGSPLSDSEKR